ncbi:UDP-N-acetylmuramoyl-tripeptide--D-alanyl-D-alanine ligase [Kocuria massiliensis]|uniref:UDP-N-acetylmuramoyl-tripeptide--D-alanyl-D- alanine ligase n=1 Tax=Kocuria massiliensis TaxID=1926282 RepID=UPI0022B9B148|nr:UDP-N-acetylmuramoyl-tripeptide--D-alanyl-D-alanine ligase [Kocuria massiliensis]
MIELTVQEIADAVAGRVVGMAEAERSTVSCDSATTDSRDVVPGTLFIAKPGEVTDGHRFVGGSRAAGSPVALAEREVTDESGEPYPAILVDDVVAAMGRLAHHIVGELRRTGDVTVIGITGSAGKTTTKDLLAGIFGAHGPTIAPVGSYNGEVGVPLTVFRADRSTRFLVIEMGANHIGNIRYLCDMVMPDLGAILKVGTAHAGEFGGVENIAITKSELADGVAPDGGVALNIDDPRVAPMQAKASAPVTYFGVEGRHVRDGEKNLVEARNLRTDADGCPRFQLAFPDGGEFDVASKLIGEHHVYNLLAAAVLAFRAGIEPRDIVEGLNTLGAGSRYRMERTDRADGVTVINDAYNANPESMSAALRTLAQMGRDAQPPRRTWAVLGPMLELGDASVEEHDKLGRQVVRLNIPKLIVIGDEAAPIFNAAHLEGSWGDEAVWVKDVDEAYEILRRELREGDIALFKSSNGAGLRFLGDRVAHDHPGDPHSGHELGRKAQGTA